MLIQFNFRNYKSYLNETSLDMTATSLSELHENIIEYKKDEKYLKSAVIYGANGSGKTNVLKAFEVMRYWVLKSFELSSSNLNFPQKPFQFCEKGKNGKSMFEVFFSYNDKEYQYGYLADSEKIYEEWLYKRNFKSKYELVFERDQKKFNLNEDIKTNKKLLQTINEKVLALSVLSKFDNIDITNVANWFNETDIINFGDSISEALTSFKIPKSIFNNKIVYHQLLQFLSSVDLSIEGLRYDKFNDSNDEEIDLFYVYTLHRNIDTKKLEEIPIIDESSGTRKMITIFSFIYKPLENGATIFIDEMDAKLHPLLTRQLINLFHSEDTNPNNAQLIFTTHDTNTLTNELFRRDQIWFSEKDKNGISSLYSLAEYKINDTKIRKDASYSKNYLGGRYGAIPNLDNDKAGE